MRQFFLLFFALLITSTGCITINKVETKRDLVYPRHEIQTENIQQGVDCLKQAIDFFKNEDNQESLKKIVGNADILASALQTASGLPIKSILITDGGAVKDLAERIIEESEDIREKREAFVHKHDRERTPASKPIESDGFSLSTWFWTAVILIVALAIFAPSVLILMWKRVREAVKKLNEEAAKKLEIEEKAKDTLIQVTDGVEKFKEAHPEMEEEIHKHLRDAQIDPEVKDIIKRVKHRNKEIF